MPLDSIAPLEEQALGTVAEVNGDATPEIKEPTPADEISKAVHGGA